MPAKSAPNESLFKRVWVHVHEEDSTEGQVYRPEEDDIPLSRRPRERIQLRPDGSASFSVPGPDDGYVEKPASWTNEEEGLVIRTRGGEQELRLVRQEPSRLIIRAH
ncbi:MAG: hypothetical protein ACR2HH_01080 [Chthoniobacterales bacterium]